MTDKNLEQIFLKYKARVQNARLEIARIVAGEEGHKESKTKDISLKRPNHDSIYSALANLSLPLASSYAQVKNDLEDENRVSWAGTAHEIREIFSNLLRLMAPDQEVTQQSWYKKAPDTNGPTQKQRVKYILQKQSAGSKQKEVTELATQMEDIIGNLVRASYSRASDAAHRLKGRTEAKRLFKYFEAFSHDLLDLQ